VTFEHTILVLVWVYFLKEIYTKQVLVLNSFEKHSEHPGYWAGARFLAGMSRYMQ
jgi:hypothetical protein